MSTKDRFSDLNKNTRTEGGLPVISERNIHFKVIANQDANVTSYAQKPVEYWEMGKSLNIQGNIFHPMKITKRGKYGIFFPFFVINHFQVLFLACRHLKVKLHVDIRR